MYAGASSIFPEGVQHHLGSRGTMGPKSMPCGASLERLEREPVGLAAVPVAPRDPCGSRGRACAPARHPVAGSPLARSTSAATRPLARRAPAKKHRRARARRSPRCRMPARDRAEADQDLPLVGPVVAGEHRRREVPRRACRPRPDALVVVRLLERGQAGQDHVGVPRRLVEPVVDADHASSIGSAASRRSASGALMHGVARDRDQRRAADPRRAWRSPPPGTTSAPGRAPRALRGRGCATGRTCTRRPTAGSGARSVTISDRVGEHRPAGGVEVAGEDVDDVDEPGGERPELLVAQADAPVDRRARRGGELARETADRRRRRRRRSSATASGEKSRAPPQPPPRCPRRRSASRPEVDQVARRRARGRSARSSAASVPGMIGIHSSARSAVPVRRGSITTVLPPRSRMRSISPEQVGTRRAGCPARHAGWHP